ncbi:hypothetical protein ASE92_12345 [Pedobacter sp. Leaf41]|nr:hypothetical protein ASE92_12345 [Pedobacter sp. Leaf41]
MVKGIPEYFDFKELKVKIIFWKAIAVAFSAFVEAPASRSGRKSGAASLHQNRSFHFQILNEKSFKPLSLQKKHQQCKNRLI